MAKFRRSMARSRYNELKKMLEERLRELDGRRVRSALERQKGDLLEEAEGAVQNDIEHALAEMQAETAGKLREAILQLGQGLYGYCRDCGNEIREDRLRALPFATRCKSCEDAREVSKQRERLLAERNARIRSQIRLFTRW